MGSDECRGSKGAADLPLPAGVGTMGGAMLRDFAIMATDRELSPSVFYLGVRALL